MESANNLFECAGSCEGLCEQYDVSGMSLLPLVRAFLELHKALKLRPMSGQNAFVSDALVFIKGPKGALDWYSCIEDEDGLALARSCHFAMSDLCDAGF